jgi:hypothetical protein
LINGIQAEGIVFTIEKLSSGINRIKHRREHNKWLKTIKILSHLLVSSLTVLPLDKL